MPTFQLTNKLTETLTAKRHSYSYYLDSISNELGLIPNPDREIQGTPNDFTVKTSIPGYDKWFTKEELELISNLIDELDKICKFSLEIKATNFKPIEHL
jgi:hypothetical protein